VFTKQKGDDPEGKDMEVLLPESLRALPYGTDTLYWYWLVLPVDVPFDDYVVREVMMDGAPDPVIDEDGVVTNEADLRSYIIPIADRGQVKLTGRQKGEEKAGETDYYVRYETGELSVGSNVRIDTVTNDRPGIIIKKEDWAGNPLAGAEFSILEASSNALIGNFVSDAEGKVTTAFLAKNKDYRLKEWASPQGYHGMEDGMIINTSGNGVTVYTREDDAYYRLDQSLNGDPAVLTIRNRPYTLQAIKQDGDTGVLLEGVHFALHKQVTVDGVTDFDLNAMEGYEDLVTDKNGVIPKIDSTLPPGTYRLKEKEPLSGYQELPRPVDFIVSKTGAVSLLSMTRATWVQLPDPVEQPDGTLAYTMTINNYIDSAVVIKKVDGDGKLLPGAKFKLWKLADTGTWEIVSAYCNIDMTDKMQVTLEHLTVGTYRLSETQAPEGYIVLSTDVYFKINQNGSIGFTNETGRFVAGAPPMVELKGENELNIINTPGSALPNTGGPGTMPLTIAGVLLVLLAATFLLRRASQRS